MNKKRIFLLLLLIFLSNTVSGCAVSGNSNGEQIKENKNGNKLSGYSKAPGEYVSIKKIVILDGCIGCGICAKIDREHFVVSAHQSVVASQDNLGTPLLKAAIKNCPTSVIVMR